MVVGYDFFCVCREDCESESGVKFYSGEEYGVDNVEFYYDVYDSFGRFLSYCSYGFLSEWFIIRPNISMELSGIFNSIMDGR